MPLLQGLLLSNAAAFGYKGAVGNGGVVNSSGDGVGSGGSEGSGSSHSSSNNASNGCSSGSNSSNGSSNNVSKMPPVEDSGTESGEDLRLLAAATGTGVGGSGISGLPNLLSEVAAALERLQASLQCDGASGGQPEVMQLDPEQRRALLALIARLQQGLQQPDKIADLSNGLALTVDGARRQSCGEDAPGLDASQPRTVRAGSSRFSAKRRTNRNNRHTVGVSREELADARRFIEEMVMMDSREQSEQRTVTAGPEKAYLLQKQHSLGTVLGQGPEVPTAGATTPAATPSTPFAMKRPSQFVPKEMQNGQTSLDKLVLPVPPARTKQSAAKEKLLVRQSLSVDQALPPGAGEKQDQPAVSAKPIDLHKHRPQVSQVVKQQTVQQAPPPELPFKKPTQTVAQRALVKKYSFNDGSSSDEDDARRTKHKPADEPKKTAEQMVLRNKITPADHPATTGSLVINTVQKIVSRETKPVDAGGKSPAAPPRRQAPALQLQNGSRTPDSHKDDASVPGRPLNKYASKKLRMKRANTIDLPKTLPHSVPSDDANGDEEDYSPHAGTHASKRVGKYAATATTVPPVEVPDFKPRTENDLKFMAFLQRQNQQSRQIWSNPVREHVGSNNWTNKFDHLKSNFEQAERRDRSDLPPKYGAAPKTSAMSFWKQAENGSFDEGKSIPPKQLPHAKSLTPNLRTAPAAAIGSSRTSQSMGKYSSPANGYGHGTAPSSPVVEGKLVLPKANVNQFSHAAASAFKPIPKKLPPANLEFRPIQHEPDIVKPIPARISNGTGLVKQIVATGFKETPEVKPEPMHVQLGLVRSLAAQGYQETPYVPLPKLERTPTHNVLNYKPRTDAPGSGESAPAAPWVGKRSSEVTGPAGSRVANIASTKFTANSFGHNKSATGQQLPVQQPLAYHGSLKYAEKPYGYQQLSMPYEKRPSLPDVSAAHLGIPYTFTDYTQPTSVSTFTLNRSDSLTNPDNAPLVLTSANSVFSPTAQPQQVNYLSVNVNNHHQQRPSPHSSANGEDDEEEYDADDLESVDSQEMRAVSKVMRAPQGQQATYSAAPRTTHLNGGGYDAEGRGSLIAQSLHSSLKKIKDKSPTPPKARPPPTMVPPPQVEITEPVQAPPQVPPHAIYNNVHRVVDHTPLARTKSSHNLVVPPAQAPRPISSEKQRTVEAYFAGTRPTGGGYMMSRTGSNQNLVMRDKAPHSQVRPVSYAMGHNVGYYNGGVAAPIGQQPAQPQSVPYQPYPRTQTGNGYAAPHYHQPVPGGLLRSRTMPHIPLGSLALLDENNVEDAFEELMNQSFAV